MFRYAKLNIKCKRFYLKVKKNQIAETLIAWKQVYLGYYSTNKNNYFSKAIRCKIGISLHTLKSVFC